MVTRDDVIWCYNTFLHRLPESDQMIDAWIRYCSSWRELVKGFSEAPETQQYAAIRSFANHDAILYHRTQYDFLFPVNMRDAPMYRTYVAHSYEEPETRFIRDHVKRGDHVIDIGVRHGWFACVMAKLVGSEGHVYCFDPDPICARFVDLCVSANNFQNISYEACALGDKPGYLEFDPLDATLQTNGETGAGLVRVAVKRLDEILKERCTKIDFIKIDVEGAEQMVFEGASGILANDRPTIIMEINDSLSRRVSKVPVMDTADTLRRLGYKVRDLNGQPLSTDSIQHSIDSHEIINVAFFAH